MLVVSVAKGIAGEEVTMVVVVVGKRGQMQIKRRRNLGKAE